MIKNARLALVASLFLGGCFVDDPAMFDTCKSINDCDTTIANSDCRTITVTYPKGSSTESFCTASCSNAGGDCSFVSANGQLSYCAGLTASGAFTTAVCLESCKFDSDCNAGFTCADNKTVAVQAGVRVCIPGAVAVIPKTFPYEYCESNAECDPSAPSCVDVSAKWIGETFTYTQPMCTGTCTADVNCPNVLIGSVTYNGTCLAAGTIGSQALCAQGCTTNSDCVLGFECADDKELDGVDFGYPVCVPHD